MYFGIVSVGEGAAGKSWTLNAWVMLMIALKLVATDIPRAKDIGWKPWVFVTLLVPGLGFLAILLLLVVPSDSFLQNRSKGFLMDDEGT